MPARKPRVKRIVAWAVVDMEYRPSPCVVDATGNYDSAHGRCVYNNARAVRNRYRVVRLTGTVSVGRGK